MTVLPPRRLALIVHPKRPVAEPLAVVEGWAAQQGIDVVEVHTPGSLDRHLARDSTAEPGDLMIALGGDGTVLSALRAGAPVDAPVLGVACGSLGMLTAVRAEAVGDALERVHAGDWTPRRLPALSIHPAGGSDEWAVNDFVAVRHDAGQLVANVSVDGELYVRLAGDGLIVSTALGSTGYSMAAGRPVLAPY